MTKKVKKLGSKSRQSASGRLSNLAYKKTIKKKKPATKNVRKLKKNSQKRSTVYKIQISSFRTLIITFRKFKKNKNKRSISYKQFAIPLYFSKFKEISIRQKVSRRGVERRVVSRIRTLRERGALSILVILAGIGGTLYFGLQFIIVEKLEPVKTFSLPAPKPVVEKEKAQVLTHSKPIHLNISSVDIDLDVITVGKNPDGTLEVPPLFEKVAGWYKYSPTPGEIGPVIITGHVDTYKGPSVFWRLREVQPGDIVKVSRADGKVVKFKVTALKQFDQDKFPTEEVYGNIDHAGLRLITCGGVFNHKTGHYTENTVVFATVVN